jgi:hypothetical protein
VQPCHEWTPDSAGVAGVVATAAAPTKRRKVIGAQKARIAVVPKGRRHPKWAEIVDFVDKLGVTLDKWQWAVLRASLMRSGGSWAAFTVGVCAPRQNGKDGILEIRGLIGSMILGEQLQIHTAHLADTSKEAFRRLDELIDANSWLSGQVKHVWRTNGHESIEFQDGQRIRFRTRTRGGGRGFSGSPLYLNEAMFLPEISMKAMLPVISAQPDPQIWYMGSAVDQTEMEDGIAFTRVRERALSGDHDRLAYFEWSLDVDTPDQVDEAMASDRASWAQSNPAYGIRITEDYLEAEVRELDARGFAVERLGVGDWPPTDGSGSEVIPLEKWDALADDPASEGARMLDPVVLAFDTPPDRATSTIVACGSRADGLPQIEIVDRRPGTGWVPDRLAELVERHMVDKVYADPAGPAGSIIHQLSNKDVSIEAVSAPDHAKACGLMFDTVDERGLRHLGGLELRQAVKGATSRPLSDAWAWSRRNSTVDISPLVAATLALWGHSHAAGDGDWTFYK